MSKKYPAILVRSSRKPNWKSESSRLGMNREVAYFTKKSREYFMTFAITVAGVVTAVMWGDFIRSSIVVLFEQDVALFVKFYIAIAATLVSMFVTYYISKVKDRER